MKLAFEVGTSISPLIVLHRKWVPSSVRFNSQLVKLFSVQIDGGISNIYKASPHETFANQRMLYGAKLGPWLHASRMATYSELSNGTLIVEHARAFAAGSLVASVENTTNGGSSSNKALIGGLCGALAFILILMILLLLWMRRRRRIAIASRNADSSFLPQVDARLSSASNLLRGCMMGRETRSDLLEGIDGPESRPHARQNLHPPAPSPFIIGNLDTVAKANRDSNMNVSAPHAPHVYNNPRSILRASSPTVMPTSDLSYDTINRNASTSRLPRNVRATPTLTISIPTFLRQPHRTTSKTEGSSMNSRAWYNSFFAQPGSSTTSLTYGPSTRTRLTSTISERPTTTSSPIIGVPPPVSPSRLYYHT